MYKLCSKYICITKYFWLYGAQTTILKSKAYTSVKCPTLNPFKRKTLERNE